MPRATKIELIPLFKDKLSAIESRFKTVSVIGDNLSKFPIKSSSFNTDKEKARSFAEVFTPLHIVDRMIQTIPSKEFTQFTPLFYCPIRVMNLCGPNIKRRIVHRK